MNKLTSQFTYYAPEDAEWPTGMKTAAMISEQVGLPEKRILELAEAQYIPHWRLDGGEPMFKVVEVKKWAAINILSRADGKSYPVELRVMVNPPDAVDAPLSIRDIPHLKSVPLGYPAGVYFLVNGDEVVYIGQSVSPLARIGQHKDSKEYDKAFMIPVPREELDHVEGALIRLFNPVLNGGDREVAIGLGNRDNDRDVFGKYAPNLMELPSDSSGHTPETQTQQHLAS